MCSPLTLAPILFYDNDKHGAAAKRTDPVAAAERSDAALTKAGRKRTEDDYPVHSFTSLLGRSGHPLRQPHPTRRRDSVHHPHTAAAASLRTSRRFPPRRPNVGSTRNQPDRKTPSHTPNTSPGRGELRTSEHSQPPISPA